VTFHPLAAQAVREIPARGHVCELGNQRFTADEPFPSTEAFYLALGFESYTALDVNTEMGARVVDLNKPIQGKHYDLVGKFDLVTNNGTGEHIFNQDAVFQNVHDLAKVGGAMLHILPMSPWVNHGFFNYNPILFRDMAAANGYEWLFLWISDRWGNRVEIPPEDFEEAFREKKPKALEGVLGQVIGARGYDASIVVAWRKVRARGFRRPFQGKYLADIADTSVKATYAG
jgi:SAM-dependent methyltransferase